MANQAIPNFSSFKVNIGMEHFAFEKHLRRLDGIGARQIDLNFKDSFAIRGFIGAEDKS